VRALTELIDNNCVDISASSLAPFALRVLTHIEKLDDGRVVRAMSVAVKRRCPLRQTGCQWAPVRN